jgi:hypothetical protein
MLVLGNKIDAGSARRGCRMPPDVGIRPLIHMQSAGCGSKFQFVDSDPMHLRTGAKRARHERDKADCQRLPSPFLARIGIGAYFSALTSCSACCSWSWKSLRPVCSKRLSSPFCAEGISTDSNASLTAS